MRRTIGLLTVFVIVVSGCNARRIPDRADETGCIVFTSNRYQGVPHIFIMRPDGSQVTRVAQGEQPAWSPDGKRIAFAWTQDHNSHRYIYLMNADGSGVVRLTESVSVESNPSWSPDGRHIAFNSYARSVDRLCVIHADRTNLQCWDLAGLAYVGQPAWSPDSSQIAISAWADGEEDDEIFVVSTECIDVAGECEPSWFA